MADNARGVLLPVYVLADESYSMLKHLAELNAGLVALYESLRAEPMIAAKVRLAVLGFAEDVQMRMGLTDVRAERMLPQLAIRGGTSYAAAFGDLLRRVPQDVAALKRDGYQVHRPAVFFLSDGQPTDAVADSWKVPHHDLVDRSVTASAPNIIACGIGEAQARTILEVATNPNFAFVSVPGAAIGRSIAQFFSALTASVVESGRALASGNPELKIERPDTFNMAIDLV
jgi:uncharacterized protein YegL